MVVLMPWEQGVRYRHGAFRDVLGEGLHRFARVGHKLFRVDTRPFSIELSGQEVPTADGVSVKVNARARVQIVDARRWVEASSRPESDFHDGLKTHVRALVAGWGFEALAELRIRQSGIDDLRLLGEPLGLEVLDFRLVDVVVPADIRRAMADVVVSRQRAAAELEAARGQSAVLRLLANSAHVLEAHPVLASLRLAETAAGAGGQVVIERPQS
jgi:regulator of protease activity HflC (stomatin/prohibitin superfamily)